MTARQHQTPPVVDGHTVARDAMIAPDGSGDPRPGGARHGRVEGHRPRDRRGADRRGRAGRDRLALGRSGSRRRLTRSAPAATRSTRATSDAVGPLRGPRRGRPRADRHLRRQHRRPAAGPDPLGFTREQWEEAHRTLVLSPMAFLERLLPGMRSRGFGRVVAIGSIAAIEPVDALQLSNAHRPGLVAAFKVLARQAAADGVTLNHVHPGQIATDRIFGNAGSREAAEATAREAVPRRPARHRRGARSRSRLPLLGAGELHHGHEPARRRRPLARRSELASARLNCPVPRPHGVTVSTRQVFNLLARVRLSLGVLRPLRGSDRRPSMYAGDGSSRNALRSAPSPHRAAPSRPPGEPAASPRSSSRGDGRTRGRRITLTTIEASGRGQRSDDVTDVPLMRPWIATGRTGRSRIEPPPSRPRSRFGDGGSSSTRCRTARSSSRSTAARTPRRTSVEISERFGPTWSNSRTIASGSLQSAHERSRRCSRTSPWASSTRCVLSALLRLR